MDKTKFLKALKKRALGCKVVESIEEYGMVDGNLSLIKQKVTKKDVPPDVVAMKLLLDLSEDTDALTDEQLEAEKQRLLGLLKDNHSENIQS